MIKVKEWLASHKNNNFLASSPFAMQHFWKLEKQSKSGRLIADSRFQRSRSMPCYIDDIVEEQADLLRPSGGDTSRMQGINCYNKNIDVISRRTDQRESVSFLRKEECDSAHVTQTFDMLMF